MLCELMVINQQSLFRSSFDAFSFAPNFQPLQTLKLFFAIIDFIGRSHNKNPPSTLSDLANFWTGAYLMHLNYSPNTRSSKSLSNMNTPLFWILWKHKIFMVNVHIIDCMQGEMYLKNLIGITTQFLYYTILCSTHFAVKISTLHLDYEASAVYNNSIIPTSYRNIWKDDLYFATVQHLLFYKRLNTDSYKLIEFV